MEELKLSVAFTLIGVSIVFALFLTACTISFQNISTHGTATDLVDQTQSPKADVDADLSIPAGAL